MHYIAVDCLLASLFSPYQMMLMYCSNYSWWEQLNNLRHDTVWS